MFYSAAVYKLGCKRLIDSNGFSYSIGVSGEESAIKEQKANQIKTFRAYGFERLLPYAFIIRYLSLWQGKLTHIIILLNCHEVQRHE